MTARLARLCSWLAIAGIAAGACGAEDLAVASHPALNELSGLVKSDLGDFYWTHNDSGDSARLFAINAAGVPLVPYWLGVSPDEWQGHMIHHAVNVDWESIALANGVLYLADVGNNGNARRDLGVYVVNEPQPTRVVGMKALRHLPIRYPDQEAYPGDVWHFDCEAVFVADGKLHFITKHRQAGQIAGWEAGAKLYRLDTDYADRENVLTLVGRRDDVALATGADPSPDGSRLAVVTYTALWLFDRPAQGGNWFAGEAWKLDFDRSLWDRQLETVAWRDDASLLLVNERQPTVPATMMRVDVAEFVPAEAVQGKELHE